MQELRKEVQQRSAEVGAQQMALAGVGGERDACRSAVQEASQRAEVRPGFSLPLKSAYHMRFPWRLVVSLQDGCLARLQALAAEVVALEEKYLQAKSMELRAARQRQEEAAKAARAQQLHASAAAECAELRTMLAALQATPCGLRFHMSWLVANIIDNCNWSCQCVQSFSQCVEAFAINYLSARLLHCRRRSRSGLSIFDRLQYQLPSQLHSRRAMTHCSRHQMHRQQSHLRMRRRRHLRQGEALP